MKKRVWIPVLLAVLLLSGCNLRNRRPSTDFIPATNAPRPTSEAAEENEPAQKETVKKELTRHSVRTVVSEIATYTDIYGKQWRYEFRLPFVDYPSVEAADANFEIDTIYRRAIDDQVKLAELSQPLTVPEIDYECYYTGTIVTVNVWMVKNSGDVERAVYCFRPDGTMASSKEILEAVWINPDDFLEKLREELKERYVSENAGEEAYVTYDYYLEKTMQDAEKINNVSLYADDEDKVTALARLYDSHGGVRIIEMKINP